MSRVNRCETSNTKTVEQFPVNIFFIGFLTKNQDFQYSMGAAILGQCHIIRVPSSQTIITKQILKYPCSRYALWIFYSWAYMYVPLEIAL